MDDPTLLFADIIGHLGRGSLQRRVFVHFDTGEFIIRGLDEIYRGQDAHDVATRAGLPHLAQLMYETLARRPDLRGRKPN
jgi:hypothetical protein